MAALFAPSWVAVGSNPNCAAMAYSCQPNENSAPDPAELPLPRLTALAGAVASANGAAYAPGSATFTSATAPDAPSRVMISTSAVMSAAALAKVSTSPTV